MASLTAAGPGSSDDTSEADWKHAESTPKPEPTVYRYIAEGSGGTYTFADGDIQYIGTRRWSRQINSEQEAVIKQIIKAKLDAEQESSN
ncbi:hypothetical protein LTR78_002702 [Recurvomyces mirabilis]|uniref:Uncharacterized protein n=1 Tax=Recurvomyces mirabilis TaxID=574656 RepID=A0AAE0WSC0_9PEZI|nr:hypothetical protein LTR78_002702 [Recurvomyces mirabilis]KAK5159563.1 hypothetical protein LTS14_002705 [Recurvomyces mirabilis]